MKYTNKFLGALCLAAFGFASCADDYSLLDYEGIEKPVDMAAYEYLKDYNDLKSYVDRSASPNFKLGTGITASQYNEGGLVQRLAVNNFDEVTPGNAMKHASVVGNDGSMNFGTVSSFVSNARAAGQTIYGHTLLWHAQQNTKYLNNLIAPQIIKPEKPAGGNGGYALTFSNENTSGNIWDQQAQTTTATTSVAGKTYVLKMMIKGSDDGEIAAVWQQNADPWPQTGFTPNIPVTTQWTEVETTVTTQHDGYDVLCLNYGKYAGQIWVDNISLCEDGTEDNLITNSTFEDGTVEGWFGNGSQKKISEDGEGYATAPAGAGYSLTFTNESANTNIWDSQAQTTTAAKSVSGTKYVLKLMVKGSVDGEIAAVWQQNSGSYPQTGFYPNIAVTTQWTEVEASITAGHSDYDTFCLNYGKYEGQIWVDNISLCEDGTTENLITNSDFEDGTADGWFGNGSPKLPSEEGDGYSSGAEPGFALKMTNTEKKTDNWAAQVWYNLPEPLTAGTSYTFTCMAKATEEYASVIFIQASADGAQDMFYGSALPITTQWSEVSITFQTEKTNIDKFTFNFGDFAGTIFIDDCKLVETGMRDNLIANGDFEAQHKDGWQSWGNYETLSEKGEGYAANASADIIIEKTPEEKEFLLTTALGNWIAGIMEATEGYVTSWDAVNEIISGQDNDGDGFYDLRSASDSDADTKKNFYWADYISSETIVPTVIKMAHKHYSGDGSLKLFINDFNLESWWDDNQKLKSLIHWIEVWESSDIIKIDGIGTQMHVSYILNEEDQKKQEAAIENMFKLMAATGKLVKISELDMGVVEKAFGEGIKTENITEEMHMKMADFYQFIIKKYFELIPADQQYGITHWCPTDSPADSGWRAGQPVGLWDKNYNRKHVYAGFADGLAGVEDEEVEEDVESAE